MANYALANYAGLAINCGSRSADNAGEVIAEADDQAAVLRQFNDLFSCEVVLAAVPVAPAGSPASSLASVSA